MHTSLVLTIIGPDRPGLVESVSAVVAQHGANWLESRMAHLAGQFAGILHVHVPTDSVEPLTRALHQLENEGLAVVVQHSGGDAGEDDSRAIALELVGQDRPGIVREISSALARQGVNVDELETTCEPAPMSGEMLFKANAKLHVPAKVSLDDLRAQLETLAQDLMVEISLDEAE